MTFELRLPGRVAFGRGAFEAELPALAAPGGRILVVHSASTEPLAARIAGAQRQAGGATAFVRGRGEPDLAALRAALDAIEDAPDRVVAVGGGAVIDLGKALAALIPARADPMRHLEVVGEGRPLPAPPLPFAAIPTTAGTGAEATKNAVIGVPEAGRKVSLRDDRMLPDLALVDPALTEGVPRAVRLASGLDAVVQVIEPFLSRGANPMTDALCRDAIPRGLRALRAVVEAPDAAAYDDMALVSLTGGIALANAGLGAVHGLAGVLGGRTGAAHGALCGRLLVPVLRANLPHVAPDRAAVLRGWIDAVHGGLDGLEAWIDGAGLPRLEPVEGQAIAEEARDSSSMKGNPVDLSTDALIDILRAAS